MYATFWFFERCIGSLNALVFFSLVCQVKAFLFRDGITPAERTIRGMKIRYWNLRRTDNTRNLGFLSSPTIFLYHHSDEALYMVAIVCEVLGMLVGLGIVEWPYSVFAIFLCSLSWLSYHTITQPWLGKFSVNALLTFEACKCT